MLDISTVDSKTRDIPGVFIVGNVLSGTFVAKTVGRCDENLNRSLKRHLGKFGYFYYDHADNPSDAYQKECLYYHTYVDKGFKLENTTHPKKPKGYKGKCEVCGS